MKKLLFALALLAAPVPALAQTQPAAAPAAPAPAAAPAVDADMQERMALATKMADLTPPADAVNMFIRGMASHAPSGQVATVQQEMSEAFDYQKFRDFVIKTMASTFTASELKAMVAYHSSPEAASIARKMPGYEARIKPEMTRMLDTAMMVARTGGKADYKAPPPAQK